MGEVAEGFQTESPFAVQSVWTTDNSVDPHEHRIPTNR